MNTEKDRSLNKDAVKRLASLVNKTDSKLILHSGWRFWFDNNMTPLSEEAEDFAESLDTAGIFLSGRTPDFSTEDIRSSRKFSKVKADVLGSGGINHPESLRIDQSQSTRISQCSGSTPFF